MARAFCIPGVFFLLSATVLLILTSISLPFLTALDITRVHFNGSGKQPSGVQGTAGVVASEVRLGIWGYCVDDQSSNRECHHQRAYTFSVKSPSNGNTEQVRSSWTRGLAVHPVAAAVAFFAFLLSLSTHLTVTLFASLVSFLAALITLIAFAIDIALFALVKHEMDNLDIGAKTNTGPGFWLTFVSLILLLLAGCTVCFGRRRDRQAGRYKSDAYPATTPNRGGRWRRWGRRTTY